MMIVVILAFVGAIWAIWIMRKQSRKVTHWWEEYDQTDGEYIKKMRHFARKHPETTEQINASIQEIIRGSARSTNSLE